MKINAKFDHFNFNVSDLDKSLEFYDKALGLKECRRHIPEDKSFILAYLTDEKSGFQLELTYLLDHTQKYDLGENEIHLCVRVEGDYEQIRQYHKEMGCVCYENERMHLYFIEDPDGYWIEVLPMKK